MALFRLVGAEVGINLKILINISLHFGLMIKLIRRRRKLVNACIYFFQFIIISVLRLPSQQQKNILLYNWYSLSCFDIILKIIFNFTNMCLCRTVRQNCVCLLNFVYLSIPLSINNTYMRMSYDIVAVACNMYIAFQCIRSALPSFKKLQ